MWTRETADDDEWVDMAWRQFYCANERSDASHGALG